MKLVTSQVDKQDKSIQAVTARNEVLNKEIEAQKNKVSTFDYGQGNVPPLPSFLPQNDNKCTRKRQAFTTPYLCIINEHTKRCDIVYTEVFFYGSLSKDTRTTQGRD